LTCHFFQLLALAVSLLASGVIQLCGEALLVNAVGPAPLLQPRLRATLLAVVAVPAVTGDADIKDSAASRPLTELLVKSAWQSVRAFPKAGLDRRVPIMAVYDSATGGSSIGSARFGAPIARYDWGLFCILPLGNKDTRL
jgi:hypothetical protein